MLHLALALGLTAAHIFMVVKLMRQAKRERYESHKDYYNPVSFN